MLTRVTILHRSSTTYMQANFDEARKTGKRGGGCSSRPALLVTLASTYGGWYKSADGGVCLDGCAGGFEVKAAPQ